MVEQTYIVVAVQLLIAFLIAYDAYRHRDWLSDLQLVVIVGLAFLIPVLGAFVYLLAIYSREKKLVECPRCGEQVHMEEDRCPNCGYDSKQEVHEPTHEGPYTCDECGKEFETRRGLNEHMSGKHAGDEGGEDDEEGFVCDACGDAFDSERGLHVHQAQKHE